MLFLVFTGITRFSHAMRKVGATFFCTNIEPVLTLFCTNNALDLTFFCMNDRGQINREFVFRCAHREGAVLEAGGGGGAGCHDNMGLPGGRGACAGRKAWRRRLISATTRMVMTLTMPCAYKEWSRNGEGTGAKTVVSPHIASCRPVFLTVE